MQYRLTTPVTREELAPLKAGDTVLLSGVVYTARDAAHKRLMELLQRQGGQVRQAAQAAAQGAEATKQYVSKFGRAKSYGTKTIGTPDAGAVSMSWFFQGLARE
mgnify:CR=1 FL=1